PPARGGGVKKPPPWCEGAGWRARLARRQPPVSVAVACPRRFDTTRAGTLASVRRRRRDGYSCGTASDSHRLPRTPRVVSEHPSAQRRNVRPRGHASKSLRVSLL